MPEICRFYGIVIRINFREHLPAHFHAEYGDEMALIDIRTLAVFEGRLPPKAMGLVAEWASLHQAELDQAWDRAQQHLNPGKIDPLRWLYPAPLDFPMMSGIGRVHSPAPKPLFKAGVVFQF